MQGTIPVTKGAVLLGYAWGIEAGSGRQAGETDRGSSQRALCALLRNLETMLSGCIVHLCKPPKVPSGTRWGINKEISKAPLLVLIHFSCRSDSQMG